MGLSDTIYQTDIEFAQVRKNQSSSVPIPSGVNVDYGRRIVELELSRDRELLPKLATPIRNLAQKLGTCRCPRAARRRHGEDAIVDVGTQTYLSHCTPLPACSGLSREHILLAQHAMTVIGFRSKSKSCSRVAERSCREHLI